MNKLLLSIIFIISIMNCGADSGDSSDSSDSSDGLDLEELALLIALLGGSGETDGSGGSGGTDGSMTTTTLTCPATPDGCTVNCMGSTCVVSGDGCSAIIGCPTTTGTGTGGGSSGGVFPEIPRFCTLSGDICLLNCNNPSCKQQAASCIAGTPDCLIQCNEEQTCEQADISSNGATDFAVQCTTGEQACKQSNIDCEEGSNCIITCIGKQTCEESFISAINAGSTLSVLCNGEDACDELKVICPSQATVPSSVTPECEIRCTTSDSCQSVVVTDDDNICECTGVGCTGVTGCPVGSTGSSAALRNGERMIAFKHDDGDVNDNDNKITLSVSELTSIHLWGMIIVFVVANIGLFLCCNNRVKLGAQQKNYASE